MPFAVSPYFIIIKNRYRQLADIPICSLIVPIFLYYSSDSRRCFVLAMPASGVAVVLSHLVTRGRRCLPQHLEVVPLFGDMQIAPFSYIRRSVNFDASRWPLCTSGQESSQANLLANLGAMKDEHDRYVSEIARRGNEVGGATVVHAPSVCGAGRREKESPAVARVRKSNVAIASRWSDCTRWPFTFGLDDDHCAVLRPLETKCNEGSARFLTRGCYYHCCMWLNMWLFNIICRFLPFFPHF